MVTVGRGGAGGKAPQVHVDTLPPELRDAWYLGHGIDRHEKLDPDTGAVIAVSQGPNRDARHDKALAVAQWRLDVIRPILPYPRQSSGRSAMITEVAAVERRLPGGSWRALTRMTIYNWLRAFETKGLAGLMPKVRKDKGTKHCAVTLTWDNFFAPHIDAANSDRIAAELTHYIRSLWGSGEHGKRAISEKATTRLIEMSRELRILDFDRLDVGRPVRQSGTGTQFEVCFVNTRRVDEERKFSVLAVKPKDNARFQDNFMPHIMRDYAGYKPRDIVVGDVHPMDVMMRREDGSTVYPKAIAWMDVATNEVHMTFVLLEKGEGIRREHVAQSFEAMVGEWSLPKLLYLDNGSEYSWDAMIDGFTQLSKLTEGAFEVSDLSTSTEVHDRVVNTRQAVVRSLAYNAKGKPKIEGAFGNLEQVQFSLMPGWTAGDRMSKKTHAKGKAPVAFPGTGQDFLHAASTQLEWYHKRPQHGRLDGCSPNEALRNFIDDGWGKTVLENPNILKLAFAEEFVRVPQSGRVSFKNRFNSVRYFYADELLTVHKKVTLRVPAYDPDIVFCFDGDRFICTAQPERSFGILDRAGAEELGRRKKHYLREIKELARHCSLLDLVGETRRHNQHMADTPQAPVAAKVSSDVLSRMAEAEKTARAELTQTAVDPSRTRVPEQWKTPRPKAVEEFEFAEEDDD